MIRVVLHEEISKEIIGAGIAVLKEPKPGTDEKLYENEFLIELVARGHTIGGMKPRMTRMARIGIETGNVVSGPRTGFNQPPGGRNQAGEPRKQAACGKG